MLQCNYNKNENYLSYSSIFDTPGRSKTSKRKKFMYLHFLHQIFKIYKNLQEFTIIYKIYKNLQNFTKFVNKFTELTDLQGLDFHLIILKLFDVV